MDSQTRPTLMWTMTLELRDVRIQYGDADPLCERVNLVIGDRDFVVIEGASGCGKSSLLRTMNFLQSPAAGDCLLGGVSMYDQDITSVRRMIGFVPQTPVMTPGTVGENLMLGFRFRAGSGIAPPDNAGLIALLHQCLLDGVSLDAPASTLSVGQRQRLALLRAELMQPTVLLCDEPTSSLDDRSRLVVENRLATLNRDRGIAIVLVTHQRFSSSDFPVRRCRFERHTLVEIEDTAL